MSVACSPVRGSEPGVGWNRAIQSARFFETWVITEENMHADEIRSYLRENGEIDNLHFVFVKNGRIGSRLRKRGSTYYLSYRLWQIRAAKVAKMLHDVLNFDLVHQVTYCGYREPGFARQLGIPFVWGPVGGTQNLPWQYMSCLDARGRINELTRSVLNNIQFSTARLPRAALRSADTFMVANSSIQADFEKGLGISAPVRLEIGTNFVRSTPRPPRTTGGPLRLLWSGEHIPRKALPLLLQALTKVPSDFPVELSVLGRGPCSAAWQKLIVSLGIEKRVRWIGWLPHAEAKAELENTDLFVFTSLRDTTGTVLLEALSHGVPVLCLDHQGARDLVTDRCGLKVPVTHPEQTAQDLAQAIVRFGSDSALQMELGRGAIEHAAQFLWDAQGEEMAGIYRAAILRRESSRAAADRRDPINTRLQPRAS